MNADQRHHTSLAADPLANAATPTDAADAADAAAGLAEVLRHANRDFTTPQVLAAIAGYARHCRAAALPPEVMLVGAKEVLVDSVRPHVKVADYTVIEAFLVRHAIRSYYQAD